MALSNKAATIAPVSLLVGGSAIIYSSVLRHPSSSNLTPLSLFYMVLLAVQYSVQPRLSKRYISRNISKQTVAMWEEIAKTSMAAFLFCIAKKSINTGGGTIPWNLSSSLITAGVPAVLYAFQGVFQYTSQQHLDSVTFNGLSQAKTLSAALCCYWILGKQQSPIQIVALLLLFWSALLFQQPQRQQQQNRSQQRGDTKKMLTTTINPSSFRILWQKLIENRIITGTTATNSSTKNTSKNNDGDDEDDEKWFRFGVVPCMAATFLSGFAGALSQKGLQITGGGGGDAFLFTMEVSLYSALTLWISLLIRWLSSKLMTSSSSTALKKKNPIRFSWKLDSYASLIPILSKAAGGVLTALVHKHAGSVTKGFALMFGLVLSTIWEHHLLNNNNDKNQLQQQPHQLLGTLLVMVSGWMHMTNPSIRPPTP